MFIQVGSFNDRRTCKCMRVNMSFSSGTGCMVIGTKNILCLPVFMFFWPSIAFCASQFFHPGFWGCWFSLRDQNRPASVWVYTDTWFKVENEWYLDISANRMYLVWGYCVSCLKWVIRLWPYTQHQPYRNIFSLLTALKLNPLSRCNAIGSSCVVSHLFG